MCNLTPQEQAKSDMNELLVISRQDYADLFYGCWRWAEEHLPKPTYTDNVVGNDTRVWEAIGRARKAISSPRG